MGAYQSEGVGLLASPLAEFGELLSDFAVVVVDFEVLEAEVLGLDSQGLIFEGLEPVARVLEEQAGERVLDVRVQGLTLATDGAASVFAADVENDFLSIIANPHIGIEVHSVQDVEECVCGIFCFAVPRGAVIRAMGAGFVCVDYEGAVAVVVVCFVHGKYLR